VRPLRDFAAAIGFLTLLPLGRTWPEGRMPRSVGWYAWVGWLLAAVAVLPLALVRRYLGAPDVLHALLYAVLIVGLWALLTRFLHWDGLADTFDGVWGGSTPQRRLEIMRDSRVGAFGVVAMLLTALVQIACVALLVTRGALWPLLVAPVVARFCASLAAWELPMARPDGLGAAVAGPAGAYERVVAGAALVGLLVCVALGTAWPQFVIVAAAGIVAGLVLPRALSKPVGGMTGDILGATVLLVETIVLLTAAIIL
jgi:adenosylcobinamide-GDP ribazoletransferase